jgi:hypothetical protein
VHVLRIADLGLSRKGVLDLRIFKEKVVLPFPEAIGKLVVSFLAHHIFLYMRIIFYFFEDGGRIKIYN